MSQNNPLEPNINPPSTDNKYWFSPTPRSQRGRKSLHSGINIPSWACWMGGGRGRLRLMGLAWYGSPHAACTSPPGHNSCFARPLRWNKRQRSWVIRLPGLYCRQGCAEEWIAERWRRPPAALWRGPSSSAACLQENRVVVWIGL